MALKMEDAKKRQLKLWVDPAVSQNPIAEMKLAWLRNYCDVEFVGTGDIDNKTVAVGMTNNIKNRKIFNKAGFAVGVGLFESQYEDYFFPMAQVSPEDLSAFISALAITHFYGDVDDDVVPAVKEMLASDYSMNGEWTASADSKIWVDEKTPYLTVQNAIKRLINDMYVS